MVPPPAAEKLLLSSSERGWFRKSLGTEVDLRPVTPMIVQYDLQGYMWVTHVWGSQSYSTPGHRRHRNSKLPPPSKSSLVAAQLGHVTCFGVPSHGTKVAPPLSTPRCAAQVGGISKLFQLDPGHDLIVDWQRHNIPQHRATNELYQIKMIQIARFLIWFSHPIWSGISSTA